MAKYNKEKRLKLLQEATIDSLLYTDSHFHALEIMKKGIDINELLSTLDKKDYLALDIGINENDIKDRYELLKNYENIYLTTGIGPWGTKDKDIHSKNISILENNIKNYPIKAIGEIGLDNHWDYGSKELQTDLFIKQIELANSYNLPIVIHNREANEQLSEIIKSHKFTKSGIIHCFSADKDFAKIALDNGFYISFAATITYKKNEELRDALQYIPLDRLLLETDSPYLPPQPFRGKINTPLLIPLVYKQASETKKVDVESISINVRKNLLTLLGCF